MARKSKGICDDLIERLQEHHQPVSKAVLKYGEPSTPVNPYERPKTIEDLEKEIQLLKSYIPMTTVDGEVISKAPPPVSIPEEPKKEEPKDIIARELQEIVDRFNKELEAWHKKFECVANFSWGYTGCKNLEIASVDYIVYRKPAPNEKTVREVLARAPKILEDKV